VTRLAIVSLLAVSLSLAACQPREPHASAASTAVAPPAPIAPPPAPTPVVVTPPAPPPPATVERIAVANDEAASIVRALDDAPPKIVFVAGLCSNVNAYLQTFPEAARRHGGVVGIEGDQKCVPGFHSYSWDAPKLDARIQAALVATGSDPKAPITLVGYSQGAALAEQLIQKWPARYARLVLIGAPTDPAASHFASARSVVTMSCSRDVTWRMKDAARRINATGVPATYVEMPGCSHGNITEGDAKFDAVFDWMNEHSRAS
jgi:pimeloyl-ACP methyl ester carboxylesterase